MRQGTMQDAIELFRRGTIALAKVERNGIRVDLKYIGRSIRKIEKQMVETEAELKADEVWRLWRKRYGAKAKLGNREQLAGVLFDEMGYKSQGLSEVSQRYKANEAALASVDHPFVKKYLRLSKMQKAHGTYLLGIRRETVDGFLHPFFNLNTARTFRSSSDKPNFQNMPIRNKEMGKLIRSCFIARDGHQIVEIDFGGIEVRVAACYHKDPRMLKYIKDPSTDMHRDMAAEIYLCKQDQVTKEMRHAAKNMFVFPSFYGSFYAQCAPNLWQAIDRDSLQLTTGLELHEHLERNGITKLGRCEFGTDPKPGTFEYHIQQVEKDFWGRRFKVYAQWKRDWYDKYLARGYFDLKTGFRIAGNLDLRRNDVINYPIQGAAFHCLLWCLAELQDWLEANNMKTCIVGQIHDSVVADVHQDELEAFLNKAHELMTKAILKAWEWIIVPLEIEADVAPVGGSWHDKAKYSLN
jgi:DNA polymerase-1